ncbi:MAG: 50S ribosomal protein L17 [Planctomycetes bacterium]|nr:50S ribosomal protein L17 [Planctomycetota bacterium]OUU21080.1 MAG: 50S ribosomal protein L17 [Planctomycetia bacterium TMED53]
MRHRVAGKKLNRNSSHRKALSRNLIRAMIIEWKGKGHIVTTRSKAKFIQPKVEKMITLAKEKTVHNIRRAMAEIGDREVVQVLFDEIGPYYQERPGGYTRILRMVKPRLGDAAIRAYLGFVREDDEYPEGDRRAKGTADSAAAEPVSEVTSEDQALETEASVESEGTESEGSDSEPAVEAESPAEEAAEEESASEESEESDDSAKS